ncbi:hypothetical protein TSUD_314970 [Trifolium subterraneum]|uniref:Uncharacterized protein n=1 Tax=Trifolium subterraneum TaxID=3900 RepID=A0A2Z6MSM2_TRISU|nr:hypothetical protein TSUD_314970 [Trifolium subterraneum]
MSLHRHQNLLCEDISNVLFCGEVMLLRLLMNSCLKCEGEMDRTLAFAVFKGHKSCRQCDMNPKLHC